jgi:hypothetical protein
MHEDWSSKKGEEGGREGNIADVLKLKEMLNGLVSMQAAWHGGGRRTRRRPALLDFILRGGTTGVTMTLMR